MPEITLAQILQCREDRVRLQKEFLNTYQVPVLCFTMNIAGPVKTSPLIERGFETGIALLEQALSEGSILQKSVQVDVTGCQAIYAISMDAKILKKICTQIEEATPLGRLFDMDVLDTDGSKLSRDSQRGCLVCGAPSRGCAARRTHSVAQLQSATTRILRAHFAQKDQETIARMAVDSLLEEVQATPKPGLVDRRNNGSHRDMTIHTFTASAKALESYFRECVRIGQNTSSQHPDKTFALLRQAGKEAEKAMYQATGGVNTHKGAIYSMGILCGSLGRLWNPLQTPISLDSLLSQCASLSAPAAKADFAAMTGTTPGERLYLNQGITGIRGEASAGFPSLRHIALPVFCKGLELGRSREEAGILALLHLIAQVEDTNLLHRGGPCGAAWAANATRTLLKVTESPARSQIEELDAEFISRNLSPGGCADLLALAFFLTRLQDSGYVLL